MKASKPKSLDSEPKEREVIRTYERKGKKLKLHVEFRGPPGTIEFFESLKKK